MRRMMRLSVGIGGFGLLATAAWAQAPATLSPEGAQIQVMELGRAHTEREVGQLLSAQYAEIVKLKAEIAALKKAAAEKDKKPTDAKPEASKP